MNDEAPALDPVVGRCVNGRFRLTSLIARGGMGKVYRAEQAPLGRVCAVKLLDASFTGDVAGGLDKRFWLEAAVTSRLNHPNIVTVFECGRTEDDVPYIAMEYLVGCTLSRAIRAAGHFSEERTVHVARQICSALREAHAAGVVHRDLKPTNVFLVENGDEADFVKVLDFGLVASMSTERKEELTEKNLLLGSPRYMAPEQIRGERVDARADVYALGIVMYEMMTGRVPFAGPSSVQILTAHLNESPPPMQQMRGAAGPSLQMEQIVRRCIEKERGRRFVSMAEVLAALDRATEPVAAYTPAIWVGDDADELEREQAEERPAPERPAIVGRPEGLLRPAMTGATAMVAVAGLVAWGAHRSLVSVAAPPAIDQPSLAADSPAKDEWEGVAAPGPQGMAIEVIAEPPATSVKEDDVELCRATPCAILYDGPVNAPDRSHVLTIARDGYRSETLRVTAAEGPVRVTLRPTPPIAVHPAPRPPKEGAPMLLSGYRLEIPY
jgi:serine/threonine-protein kinase